MFIPTEYKWLGSGSNYKTTPLYAMADFSRELSANVIRLLMDCYDNIEQPELISSFSLPLEDNLYDYVWSSNKDIRYDHVAVLYNDIKPYSQTARIGVISSPPVTWLGKDRELFGDALQSYAYFVVSGIIVYASYGMFFDYIEVIDDPSDSKHAYISPQNYNILLNLVTQLLTRRISSISLSNIYCSQILQNTKLIGPGANINRQFDYVDALDADLISVWSIKIEEPLTDYQLFQGSGLAKRHSIKSRLNSITEMMRYKKRVQIFGNKISTNATQYDSLINYGQSYFESFEHAIRLADMFVVALTQGLQTLCSWDVHNPSNDMKALIRKDNTKRPHFELYSFLHRLVSGNVYVDETNPSLVIVKPSSNTFSVLIPRAQMFDDERTFSLQIQDTNWKSSSKSSLSMSIFPSKTKSTQNIKTNYSFTDDGILTLTFTNVPYLCVLFVRCDVYTF